METDYKYDAIFLGGGSSGRFGGTFLKMLGGKALIVEEECLGGECHRCRCAFENFVSEQASMAELMRQFSGLSWYPKIDLSEISMARAVETYRNIAHPALAEAMKHQTESQLDVEVAWGKGKIIDKNTVEVNGKIYKGKNLVIAAGSRPTIPNIPGIDLENVWTYKDHPYIQKDPKRMVIIGGGKIGIGKAGMFAAFNTEVTVLEKFKILPKWDWEIKNWVSGEFKRRGINIYEGANVKEIKGKGRVQAVVAEIGGKVMEFPCDAVMVSVGLTPNSEPAIPLGVKIGKENEIIVDKGCRTNVKGVYAVGDVVGPPYLMSVSRKRGMIAAKNIMGMDAKWDDTLPLPDHIYLPPVEATSVGLTEAEAREKYGDVTIIRLPWGERPRNTKPETFIPGFANQVFPACGRTLTATLLYYGESRNGLIKAIVDPKSRKYLGFHSIADGAKTAFQYLSYLLKIGWTVDQMAELHEVFINAEPFIQLSRLVAGQKELKGFAAQTVTEDYTKVDSA